MNSFNHYLITTGLIFGSLTSNGDATFDSSTVNSLNSNTEEHAIEKSPFIKDKNAYLSANKNFKETGNCEQEDLNFQQVIQTDSIKISNNISIEKETTNLESSTTQNLKFLPPHHYDNYILFENYFNREYNDFGYNISIEFETFKSYFSKYAYYISELKFEEAAIEFLPRNSVKFSLLFSENRSLRITKSFESKEEILSNQILYSYFENKELISANKNDLNEFIQGFNEYIFF